MQYCELISNGVHWIGINDRRKHLFENMWPLPNGVSYNSYLISDNKSALVDTVEAGSDSSYISRIESILKDRPLDYLIINHMEPDHSGELETIVRRYPEIKIVGNSKTFNILSNYYGDHCHNLMEVKDGDELDLGYHKLKFVFTPWVHWPETMMTYDMTDQILFSADAFGTFGTLDGGIFDDQTKLEYYESEMRRYYSNIVGKYSNMVQKAFAKLDGMPIKIICPLHGPIWRSNTSRVLELYDKWSKQEPDNAVVIIYASMYGNTAKVADYIAHLIACEGVQDIRVYDVSETHISYLINEIWRCKHVVLGSCSYNGEMFPLMASLCRELHHIGIKHHNLSIFGTGSWNGGGLKNLKKFAEETAWEITGEPIEIMGRPDTEKLSKFDDMAKAIAGKVHNI